MSVFAAPGLYLRDPRGGVEDVARMAEAGFRWLALNVGDHALSEWDTIRARADAAKIACLPWQYVRSNVDVWQLANLAEDEFEGRLIVNAEKPLDQGKVTIGEIAMACEGRDAAISTEPVLYGSVDWTQVAKIPIQLQLFPQENQASKRPRELRARAYERGVEQVHFMLGIHELGTSAFPQQASRYSVYCADDVAFDKGERAYDAWTPRKIPPLEFTYTGPKTGPSKGGGRKSKTAKALKLACHRLGVGEFPAPDQVFNSKLELSLGRLQRLCGIDPTGQYGRRTYEALRTLLSVTPGDGYALSPPALALIEEDA